MNINSFKLFCDVVRCHSFSQGAKLNGITQSAASQAINHLEKEFGAQLIDRRRRPFTLTAEGELCYEGLCDILHRYETIKAGISALRSTVSGLVRVAAIYSVGLHNMNRAMQTFMTLHPRAKVRLEYLLPDKIYDAVLNDEVDIGVVSYPTEGRGLSVIPLREERMVLVCHPEHRLARMPAVSLADLDGEDFVAFDRDLAICKELDRHFRLRRVSVRKVMEFNNVETIKQAVEIGAGLSILPEPTVQREVESGDLVAVRLSDCDLKRPLGIIHRQRKVFAPALTRFIEVLRAEVSPDTPPTAGGG